MVLASTPCFLLEGTGADRYQTVGLDKLPYEGDGGSSVLCHWVAAEPQLWEGPGRVLGREGSKTGEANTLAPRGVG